jgi:hypothetical protein
MAVRGPPRLTRDARATFDLAEFLARPLLAHVATASPEGARSSVFWYLWEDDALWMIAEEGFNTVQGRVRSDPRVAVGIVDFDPRTGFFQHVSLRGTASVEAWDDARGSRLLRRYYRHLDGYVERPEPPGSTVGGRLPMTFLRMVPGSVMLRELEYRRSVLAHGRPSEPETG